MKDKFRSKLVSFALFYVIRMILYTILIKILSTVINHKPVHDCPFPINPLLQVHVKLPTVLVQLALVSQLSVLVEHSSMSRTKKWWLVNTAISYKVYENRNKYCIYLTNHKPVHDDCPFPVYPVLHVHVKPPAVLVQVARWWHIWVLVEHSSISRKWIILI